MTLHTNLGQLSFRLARVQFRRPGPIDGPCVALIDGVPLRRLDGRPLPMLVLDHRREQRDVVCRMETWDCISSGEGDIGGLLVLCDKAIMVPRGRSRGSKSVERDASGMLPSFSPEAAEWYDACAMTPMPGGF